MWLFRIPLTIVSTIVASYYLEQRLGLRIQVDCSPMFFLSPQEVINDQQIRQQLSIPVTSSHLAQQEVHIDGSRRGRQEEYLLLTQEEVLNNSQVLKFLAGASKEEIEELLEQNPALRDQLYDKINKVVQRKTGQQQIVAATTSSIIPPINQQQQMTEAHVQADGQLTGPALGMPNIHSIKTEVGDHGPELAASAIGIGVLKKKLKPKFAKLIKIGGKLKKKILPLLKKKGKKKKKKVYHQGLSHTVSDDPNQIVDEENPGIVLEDDDGSGDDQSNDNNNRQKASNPLRPRFKFNVSTSSRQLFYGN